MVEYFVSPSGNNSNPGTFASPWLTPEKARSTAGINDTITLRGGRYAMTSVLAFTSAQNGQTWQAFGAELPILSFGTLVSSWTQTVTGSDLWQATYNGTCGGLSVDGVMARRHEYAYDASAWTTTPTGYTGASALNSYRNKTKILLKRKLFPWAQSFMPVDTISSGAIVCASKPNWKQCVDVGFAGHDYPATIENAYELFISNGVRGTYYHDVGNNVLYYRPRLNENFDGTNEVIVHSSADSIITCVGAANITFSPTIQLSHNYSSRLWGSNGWMDTQDNNLIDATHPALPVGAVTPANFFRPAFAVEVTSSTNCSFPCRYINLGTPGIFYGSNSAVANNQRAVFSSISGTAIRLGDLSDYSATSSTNTSGIVFAGSVIKYIGQEFLGGTGFNADYTINCSISQSIIRNLPYSGISLGLGWDIVGTVPNKMNGNSVLNCVIDRCMTTSWGLDDGSSIYTNSYQLNTTVRGNIISNCAPTTGGGGIYIDQGTGGVSFLGNVINNGVIMFAFTYYASPPGNIFDNNYSSTSVHDHAVSETNNTYGSLTVVLNPTTNISALAIMTSAGLPVGVVDPVLDPPVERTVTTLGKMLGTDSRFTDATFPNPGTSGTFSFMFTPSWNGDDGVDHVLLWIPATASVFAGKFLLFDKYLDSSFSVGFYDFPGSNGLNVITDASQIFRNGVPISISFRWNATINSLWINGIKMAEKTFAPFNLPGGLTLGSYDFSATSAQGIFSKFARYNRDLSDVEMAQLRYKDPRDVSTTGLVNFWELTSGTTEADTVSGRVLTFAGFNPLTPVQKADYGYPTQPQVPSVDGSLLVSWSAVANTSSYTVYRSPYRYGTYTALVSSLATTSYRDTSASNDTIYWYKVSAVNNAGESVLSVENSGIQGSLSPSRGRSTGSLVRRNRARA